MNPLRYTLLGDGSSDSALVWVLNWLVGQCSLHIVEAQWADLGRFPRPPKSLTDRIRFAVEQFPCEIVFVHRDAEQETSEARQREIRSAARTLERRSGFPAVVCLVPVRMMEAWLLFDEAAIRTASGNPNGRVELSIPHLKRVEALPDPKRVLHELIRNASELSGRRLRNLRLGRSVHRVAELIEDFSPLRTLPSFVALEKELTAKLDEQGWR